MDPTCDPDLAPGVDCAQLAARDVAVRSGETEGRLGRGKLLTLLTHAVHRTGRPATQAWALSLGVADLDDVAVRIVETKDALPPRLDFDGMDDVDARFADGPVGLLQIVCLEVDVEVVLALRPGRERAGLLVCLFEQIDPVVDLEAVLEHDDGPVILADGLPEHVAVEGSRPRNVAHEHDCGNVPDLHAYSYRRWSIGVRSWTDSALGRNALSRGRG